MMNQNNSKSPEMNNLLETLSQTIFKRSRLACIKGGVCVCCGKPAISFKNKLSEKEFTISGLCQKCQDGVFE
jgi:hypothetical protein